MISRHPASRWAVWAFALALLLKAAVPMLASVSAQLQGKTLVEVCTVYGVATVALDDAGEPKPMPADRAGAHGSEHCALSAVLALAAPEPGPALAVVATERAHEPPVRIEGPAPDAEADWIARLKHGPPSLT
ncbi:MULTISPECIES: DUF2946 family protein [unclassified Rhizobacter]|uniref:DUF2946 family protein n=1 Tax=unclassified Rhizobacter TaxID=2640088 RepID=UPI0006F24F8C|nr:MULTISPECIES: DUF2946 family protein [unclassified Rhizobacter]KQU78529.1 hypothetical protein ASC88_22355 [Rhizobacter sp. Root29]KQW11049.1 hypothetical protein ASC98_03645 [Rhizobacter sp. Root1238]KRB25395.1 hypothetical protein ASE08_04330 [Rhizobacter sp. Root16D2]